MSFCASVVPSTPVQMLLSPKPLNADINPPVLAAHWFGEKAEKLLEPPGGITQALCSASSSEPTRSSPKPPPNQI